MSRSTLLVASTFHQTVPKVLHTTPKVQLVDFSGSVLNFPLLTEKLPFFTTQQRLIRDKEKGAPLFIYNVCTSGSAETSAATSSAVTLGRGCTKTPSRVESRGAATCDEARHKTKYVCTVSNCLAECPPQNTWDIKCIAVGPSVKNVSTPEHFRMLPKAILLDRRGLEKHEHSSKRVFAYHPSFRQLEQLHRKWCG